MIRRAQLKNFMSHRELRCDLAPFTILVGESGSGKTSLLDGLRYATQSVHVNWEAPPKEVFAPPFSPRNLWSRGATSPMTFDVWGESEGKGFQVGLSVEIEREVTSEPGWKATPRFVWDDSGPTPAQAKKKLKSRSKRVGALRTGVFAAPPGPVDELRSALGSTVQLRLDARKIAEPSHGEDGIELAPSGAGLPSLLADFALTMPDVFQSIQEMARAIVPRLQRIRFESVKIPRVDSRTLRVDDGPTLSVPMQRTVKGEQLVLDFVGAQGIPAALVSEGTLIAIALATAIHDDDLGETERSLGAMGPQAARNPGALGPRNLRLLLLDDIEQALHPTAQRALVAYLRKIQQMKPLLQIVATSHSPYFLDCFEPHEVLVTAARPDGSAACAPLSEHPEIGRWKDVAKSGEIWSFVGEKWVTDR